jgi:sugar phosphate permease
MVNRKDKPMPRSSGKGHGVGHLRVVGLMIGLSVMSYFNRTIMSIAGPEIMKELSISATAMGAIYSAFILSYALLMIPGGRLADRVGPRRVLALSGLGTALFTGLSALGARPGLGSFLGVIPAFVLIRLGLGSCTAPLYPSCARMSANWISQSRRARVQGLIASGAGLGGAMSPLLFTWLIGRYGWRFSFLVSAAVTAALALLWYFSVEDHPTASFAARANSNALTEAKSKTPHSSFRSTSWKLLLTNPNLVFLTIGYFAVCYFEYIFFYWMFYYFGQVRQVGSSQTAWFTTILFLAWMVMTPFGGYASDRMVDRYGPRLGRQVVPIVSLSLSALFLFVGINCSGTFTAVALLSLALGLASCSDGPFWAAAIEVSDQEGVGLATGILNTGGNLGGFLAPLLTPFIAAYLGWSWGLYFGTVVLLGGLLTWFFFDPPQAHREASINLEPAI